jgi:Mn-dependent DtxR family transcriptional regulator
MREKISQATEDYLKTIYEITRQGDLATTNDIAAQLGVTAASATGMIQRLASINPPLVEYQKHPALLVRRRTNSVKDHSPTPLIRALFTREAGVFLG